MNKPMTQEEYELCRVRFGPDMESWPSEDRAAAEAFCQTPEGLEVSEQGDRLDRLLIQGKTETPVDDSEAFLDRLLDIPAQHTQIAGTSQTGGRGVGGLMSDLRGLFSPVGFAAQGAVFALVLAVGVFVGMQSPDGEAATLDLSDTLFASSTEFYLEDQ